MAIETLRELTAAEINLVAGGRNANELKKEIETLKDKAKEIDPGSKGFGGANSLA
jgi:hypothetical protein